MANLGFYSIIITIPQLTDHSCYNYDYVINSSSIATHMKITSSAEVWNVSHHLSPLFLAFGSNYRRVNAFIMPTVCLSLWGQKHFIWTFIMQIFTMIEYKNIKSFNRQLCLCQHHWHLFIIKWVAIKRVKLIYRSLGETRGWDRVFDVVCYCLLLFIFACANRIQLSRPYNTLKDSIQVLFKSCEKATEN